MADILYHACFQSLEYFTFIRLDCEKLRKGLGDAARDLANTLLQNVVDTYRKENETICAAFEEIERVALNAPKSTKEMIELGEYMLHVKNKRMLELTDEIENSKKHLLYIIDVHIFSHEDIDLNTKTLGWPVKIKPVFEQNTEIVEDCKVCNNKILDSDIIHWLHITQQFIIFSGQV